MAYNVPIQRQHPEFSLPSILAIVAAVASFFVSAGLGLILAVAAIVLGVIGFLLALSPNVRGGIVSVFSMIAGLIGIIAAIVRFVV